MLSRIVDAWQTVLYYNFQEGSMYCLFYFLFIIIISFLAKCQLCLILDVERGEGTSVTIERNIENSCILFTP